MARLVTDRQSFSFGTQRELTENGYLKVPGRVARTGVQEYLASEIAPPAGEDDPGGLRARDTGAIVKVYRPYEEVFSPESLSSYDNADVTDDHPSNMVDSATFKKVAVGHAISDGRQDGEYVVVDLLFKDQKAIDAIQSGKSELSAGYSTTYEYSPGVVQDTGEEYEFVQRDIRINHIALVDKARAGREAKLYDHQSRGHEMSTITLDGQTVEVQDKATAQLIQRAFDAEAKSYSEMEKKAKDMESEAEKLRKEMDEMKAEKDAQAEELEKSKESTSDAAISERLKSVSEVRDQAKKVAGSDFTNDSLDLLTIKRSALAKARPTIDWDKQSEHYVQAAWDMQIEQTEKNPGKQSMDAVSDDLKNRYTNDAGQMTGDSEYQKFLSGGNA